MDEHEVDRRIHEAAGHIAVPAHPLRGRARGWTATAGAIALTATVLVASLVVGQQLAERRSGGVAASPTPTASPSPMVPYESPTFGYRIQLPEGFRRSDCLSNWLSQGGTFGVEVFTPLTPDQERAQDRGHVAGGGPVAARTFSVNVHTADGRSALEWARTHGSFGGAERHESAIVNGHEAVRTVVGGEARLYMVRADPRIYLISLPPDTNVPLPGFLDAVALTFQPGTPAPIPTPTPPPAAAPREAHEVAGKLAGALEAGDDGRLAALITPQCWLDIWFPSAGPVGRAVDPYLAELRTRFAGGALRVKVDPTVQVASQDGPGGLRLFARSDWTEAGKTTRIDLFLREINGRWYWAGAQHRAP